tara:strand:+ start:11007 stop:11222 length:216 start_codon:yes stop_codon:yes gene_type:complete
MSSFKAICVMAIWTAAIAYGLFRLGAHEMYADPLWALCIASALLITHMGNMFLYFKISGEKPYQWFKKSEA